MFDPRVTSAPLLSQVDSTASSLFDDLLADDDSAAEDTSDADALAMKLEALTCDWLIGGDVMEEAPSPAALEAELSEESEVEDAEVGEEEEGEEGTI